MLTLADVSAVFSSRRTLSYRGNLEESVAIPAGATGRSAPRAIQVDGKTASNEKPANVLIVENF
jgi:hypothetical protein